MRTLAQEIVVYTSAMFVDRYFGPLFRKIVFWLFAMLILVLLCILAGFVLHAWYTTGVLSYAIIFNEARVYLGLLLIAFAPFGSIALFSLFYNTLNYRGFVGILGERPRVHNGIRYEVARILARAHGDVTESFCTSTEGRMIMIRCAIRVGELGAYLDAPREALDERDFVVPENGFATLLELGMYIYEHDTSLREFLAKRGVTKEIYEGALSWVCRSYYTKKARMRWWGRDSLSRIRGIGTEFSFGVAYELQKYMRNIRTTSVFSTLTNNAAYAKDRLTHIENILARSKGANALLVGEPGVGKMDILVQLGKNMHEGSTIDAIRGKNLVVFDVESFTAVHNSKELFELGFLKLLTQAERAGNIIIVIENVTKFLLSARSLGVDITSALDRFLVSTDLHIIATTDPMQLHEHLEREPGLLDRFEIVYIEGSDLSGTIRLLEDVAETYEQTHDFICTYASMHAIAESADRYITDGVMPDKAIDLLAGVVPYVREKNVQLVTKELVQEFVSNKTGIPTGPITDKERDVLLNLESVLHQYVIGQDHAISAISNAMRRSRADIQSHDKPIGTFLFLGSTGVGKTETAKALARVFFGSEDKMLRLDMSEYSGPDGLMRLIGGEEKSGKLADMLREHPYGVLLLDEFEKTSEEVHDLFLQILDEGIFTDARGVRINARNIIIIATSNAGSDMVWEMVGTGKNPNDFKDAIVDAIITKGTYKPELINRFDGVVIFEPLSKEHQRKIAELMLQDLKDRIQEKGYTLVINEALVDTLVSLGYDPQFGARPMRRALQDQVEERIAEKIIAGGLRVGDTIEFLKSDFVA